MADQVGMRVAWRNSTHRRFLTPDRHIPQPGHVFHRPFSAHTNAGQSNSGGPAAIIPFPDDTPEQDVTG
jgi:hypothetical protein